MSISVSARKAKGRDLQKEVVYAFREKFGFDCQKLEEKNIELVNSDCYAGDITARMMGGAGTDVVLSPAAQARIPFDVECKCQQSLNIWGALKQAESNSKEGRIPLLVIKRNHTKTYAVLEFSKLLELLK